MNEQKNCSVFLSQVFEVIVHTQGCRFELITQAFFSSCEIAVTLSGTLFCFSERRASLKKVTRQRLIHVTFVFTVLKNVDFEVIHQYSNHSAAF